MRRRAPGTSLAYDSAPWNPVSVKHGAKLGEGLAAWQQKSQRGMPDGRRPATGGMRARERAPGRIVALGSTRAEGAWVAVFDAYSCGAHRGERA